MAQVRVRGVPVGLLLLLGLLSAAIAFLPKEYLPVGLLALPLVGVIVGALLPPQVRGKTWGLAVSASTLIGAIAMAWQYDWSTGGYQFTFNGMELEGLGFRFALGVDPISLPLVLLTAALHPLAVTASLRSVHARSREHYAWMNLLLVTMLGVFMATDLLLFYAFFEASLIPLFFIVGIWGGRERKRAAMKLFVYTFAGGTLALAGIVYLGMRAGTFQMPSTAETMGVIEFARTHLSSTERFWVLMSLLAAFAVKTPLFPLHTWLPLAHTEAPTAGSVDLAALVLKLGTYGLLRLALPIGLIAADGSIVFPVVLRVLAVLCLIGIIYGALVAWVQTDIKKIVAYSSVSHLGFCVLGMLALNIEGMAGSVLYMVNHGIISGALFLIVGMIYHRYHTRDIRELSGLGVAMPRMAFFLVLFAMASVGLPGLNGFVSEFLTILGTFKSAHLGVLYGSIAAIGIVLGAIYMLRLLGGVLFGPLRYPALEDEDARQQQTVHPKYVAGGDITGREVLVLSPLAIAVVVLGVYPAPVLRSMEGALEAIRNPAAAAVAREAGTEGKAERAAAMLSLGTMGE